MLLHDSCDIWRHPRRYNLETPSVNANGAPYIEGKVGGGFFAYLSASVNLEHRCWDNMMISVWTLGREAARLFAQTSRCCRRADENHNAELWMRAAWSLRE